ncbi:MAG: hypothetical protein GY722_20530, partial [bacterium]|nr:hypothetical protein [bacterium]
MAGLPEHLLRRSAEAKAKATGRDVEEVLAEMKGETPAAPAAPAAPAEPAAPATPAAAPAASGGHDLAAVSADTGVPMELLQRGAAARARKEGRELVTTAAPAAAPTATAPAASAAPAAPPAIPEGVTTQRLL